MRHFELDSCQRRSAGDHVFYSESDEHKLRDKQHAELVGDGRDDSGHHAGDLHDDIGKRFDELKSNGNYDLHADSHKCRRLNDIQSNHHCKRSEQANDQLLYG